jgi:hypothetical protein
MANAPFNEALLQFAWQHLQFDTQRLRTTQGETVQVLQPGVLNQDQGPDFLHARVRVDGMELAGHVELHMDAREWHRHGHDTDPNFNNVILHVILEAGNEPQLRQDGTALTEVSLAGRLMPHLLERYRELQLSPAPFPCARVVADVVPQLHMRQWVHAMGWARVQGKVEALREGLTAAGYDWEQLIWQELAGALGGAVNKPAFQALAEHIPFRLMRQYNDRPELMEALLFGGAGFLAELPEGADADEYVRTLLDEWQHLAHKHQLAPLGKHRFKFAKLRPANFPTLRLAQLAALIYTWPDLLLLISQPEALRQEAGQILPSAYWQTHYRFGKASKPSKKALGGQFIENLLINCCVPMAVLYYQTLGKPEASEQAMELLQQLPPEKNRIVKQYQRYGFPAEHALDTQGLIHLQRHYCQPQRCLACAIGYKILKAESVQASPEA